MWDRYWVFGRRSSGLTVQLDHAMVALAGAGLLALALRPLRTEERARLLAPVAPLALVCAIGLLLQLRAAAPFYDWLPGAAFIQFPWRLLALVTPALVVVAVYLADQALPHEARLVCLGGAAAWVIATCGAFTPLQYARAPLAGDLRAVTFSGFREYEPRNAPPLPDLLSKVNARWAATGCSYEKVDPTNDEAPAVELRTSCGRTAVLPLPLYGSVLHEVAAPPAGRRQACLRLDELPGVCGAVVPAGDSLVSVTLPRLTSTARWLWQSSLVIW